MADVVTIAIVVLAFFMAGALVGAVSLVALSCWSIRRQASRPWRGRRSSPWIRHLTGR